MIPISKPYIGQEEAEGVARVLESGQLAQGKRVREFEERFATYCGVKHAIATSSGTSALWLALLAHNIGPGDEVITSPFTFIASTHAILYVGAKPVFVDIDAETFNLDPSKIESRITSYTKAILPIHLYGHPCDMDRIMEIVHRYNLVVIEDACQAHGAGINGQKVGSFGTGCFSFYATKNMTMGEGGIITTNDDEVAERARLLRAHGMRKRYYHETIGYNFRMTDLQAAIGLAQLTKLDQFNKQRQTNARFLIKGLSDLKDLVLPKVRAGYEHVFHQFTVRNLRNRDAFRDKLLARGVGSEIYYPVAVHKQESFQEIVSGDDLVRAEEASNQVVSLPVHPALSKNDLDKIVEVVRSIV